MGCRMFIKAIFETLQESTVVDVKNCRFLACLSDGSTDAGVSEQDIVYCRYGKEDVTDGTVAAIEKVVCNDLDNTHRMYKKGVNYIDSVKSDTNLEKLQSALSAMFLCYYYSPKKHRKIQEIISFLNKTFQ